jgi:hypothetical protein
MESVLYPVAKAMKAEQEGLAGPSAFGGDIGPLRAVLSFPIILTSQPVFQADVTGGELLITEVPWAALFRRFHNGSKAGVPDSVLFEVVSLANFEEYLERRVAGYTEEVSAALVEHRDILPLPDKHT